jgi:hypothetical protein
MGEALRERATGQLILRAHPRSSPPQDRHATGSVPDRHVSAFRTNGGTVERLVREWLSAHAAAGYLDYDPTTARS